MCGITGSFTSLENFDIDLTKSALHMMHKRGPNDKGYEVYNINDKDKLIFGHTRLSIIDLSTAGHQPMHSSDGKFSIVFNGEIYNYKELKKDLIKLGKVFLTDTDTEVLLNAWSVWEEKSLEYIDGMFSFVIFDKEKNKLKCIRDAFGIKPFFYAFDSNSFFFASDIHAVVKIRNKSQRLSYQRAYDYLIRGEYDNSEQTFIDGILHLMPGSILEYNLDTKQVSKVVKWYTPSISEREDLSFKDATEFVRETFLENIRLQLRSDVPLGAALSGGVDSSAVVCAMRYLEPEAEISTFSYIAKGADISEEVWVDHINNHTKSNGFKVEATGKDLLEDLDDLIKCQGEPFMSTSIYAQYRVFKLAKSKGITVTLDGQGADELLAGYRGYPIQRMQSMIDKNEIIDLIKFLFKWPAWPGRTLKESFKFLGVAFTPEKFLPSLNSLNSTNLNPGWLNTTLLIEKGVEFNQINLDETVRGRNVMARLAKSLQSNGLPQLLRHADRNSMNFSIESRVPFLTIPLANLTLSLPENYLISNYGETKTIFRSAMRGIVPDEVLDRKDKIGFATPEKDWLISVLPEINNWLEHGASIPILDSNAVIKEFNLVLNGKKRFTWQLWRLINFIRWCQIFDIDA